MTANPSLPVRLLVWLILQLVVLMLGAFGVPIFARHPEPRESLAIYEMLACQIGVSALIFPWLLHRWLHAIAIIFSSLPFLLIAGWLSTTERRPLILCMIHVALWLTALAGVAKISLPGSILQRALVITMSLWAVGGAVLYYLRLEFGGPVSALMFGPLVTGLKMAGGELSHFGCLPSLVLLSVALITARILRR